MSDLFNPDFDDEDDYWLPLDFLSDDATDTDIDQIHNIQDMVGRSIQDIIETHEQVLRTGRAGDLRAVRFSSGGEALLWLYRRGIFLYSTLVRYDDGSWGVAIGDSPGVDARTDVQGDIPF